MNAEIGFTLIYPWVIVCNGSVVSPWRVSCLSIYHACFTLSMSGWENWFYIQWSNWIISAESALVCGHYGRKHRGKGEKELRIKNVLIKYPLLYLLLCHWMLAAIYERLPTDLAPANTHTYMQVYTQFGNIKGLSFHLKKSLSRWNVYCFPHTNTQLSKCKSCNSCLLALGENLLLTILPLSQAVIFCGCIFKEQTGRLKCFMLPRVCVFVIIDEVRGYALESWWDVEDRLVL